MTNQQPMKIQIICANDESRNFVRALADNLEENDSDKFDIAITECETGKILKPAKKEGNAGKLIVCLTEKSVREEALGELRKASKDTKAVSSILLDNPAKVFPPLFIAHIQYINMFHWKAYSTAQGGIEPNWLKEQTDILKDLFLDSGKPKEDAIAKLRQKTDMVKDINKDFQDDLLKKDYIGGKWLLEEVENWLENESQHKVFCITGQPGIGKSLFSANLALQNKVQIAGIYYCGIKKQGDSPKDLLLSLAFQLGTRVASYREFLLKQQFDLARYNTSELFDILFKWALNFLIDGNAPKFVMVIDGLNNADDELVSFLFSNLFNKEKQTWPDWLYFLITTRSGDKKLTPFKKSLKILDMDNDARCKEDAELYIADRLRKSKLPPDQEKEICEAIKNRAASNFQWIQTIMNIIDSEENGFEAAKQFLQDEAFLSDEIRAWYNFELREKFIDKNGTSHYEQNWKFYNRFIPMFSLLAAFHFPIPQVLLESNSLVEELTGSELDGYDMAESFRDLSEFMIKQELGGTTYISFPYKSFETWFFSLAENSAADNDPETAKLINYYCTKAEILIVKKLLRSAERSRRRNFLKTGNRLDIDDFIYLDEKHTDIRFEARTLVYILQKKFGLQSDNYTWLPFKNLDRKICKELGIEDDGTQQGIINAVFASQKNYHAKTA